MRPTGPKCGRRPDVAPGSQLFVRSTQPLTYPSLKEQIMSASSTVKPVAGSTRNNQNRWEHLCPNQSASAEVMLSWTHKNSWVPTKFAMSEAFQNTPSGRSASSAPRPMGVTGNSGRSKAGDHH